MAATTNLIAAKFGGTSTADAERQRHVGRIIEADPARRCIVVSAPGKRASKDDKITDMLKDLDEAWGEPRARKIRKAIEERFVDIARGSRVKLDVKSRLKQAFKTASALKGAPRKHFLMSRGEWLNAQIVAKARGFTFVDAADFMVFTNKGRFDMRRTMKRAERISLRERVCEGIVVPGFYGRKRRGGPIWTFSRGGSDVTGAIVAVLVGADVYENWTDVEGVFEADPRIVPEAKKLDTIQYDELRELGKMGSEVFHADAGAFVRKAGIPTHIRSTITPEKPGTLVVSDLPRKPGEVTGVAVKNGFAVITVEKYGLDDKIGALTRFTRVFSKLGISIFHAPGSSDTMGVVIESADFKKRRYEIIDKLERFFKPDHIRIEDEIALVCLVGIGMKHVPGIAGRFISNLGNNGVNIELIIQGTNEMSIIVGVKESDRATAVRATRKEFFGKK